jgi:hypothetical protein
LAKKRDAGSGNYSSVACQLHAATHDQRVCERHTETAGKMVVAGPCRPQRRISRTDNKPRLGRVPSGCRLNDTLLIWATAGVTVTSAAVPIARTPGI